MIKKHTMIVGGREPSSEKEITVIYPFDGRKVHKVAAAGWVEVDMALRSAEKAFHETRRLSRRNRTDILERLAVEIEKNADLFSQTIVLETGKTIKEARIEVKRSLETIRLSIVEASKAHGGILPMDASPNGGDKWGIYERFPVGTAAFITPFNFPLNLAMHKIAPAIAVGCPFILKPASKTPLTGILLGRAVLEAGYPEGAVSVLPGSGSDIGEKLVSDPRVKAVSFTGSPDVGRRIHNMSGPKPIALELGSNSAVVINNDITEKMLVTAVERTVKGAFALAGQVCISVQRVYIHEDIFEKAIEMMIAKTEALDVGDPMEEKTDIGPVLNPEKAKDILRLIDNSGGKIIIGGEYRKLNDYPTTLFPALIKDVPEDSELIQNEIFGPALAINSYTEMDEVLDKVENTNFGLQTGIFTKDIDIARKTFERLTVGGVIVNDVPTYRADLMPYGGQKNSGLLREGPEFAIEHLTYIKAMVVNKGEN